MKILLVEDSFFDVRINIEFLSHYGEVDTAKDGKEATDKFVKQIENGQPYQLICMDVMLPVASGFDATEFIRVYEAMNKIPEDKKVKIIVLTSLNMDFQVKEAYLKGADIFFTKPINPFKIERFLKEKGLIADKKKKVIK